MIAGQHTAGAGGNALTFSATYDQDYNPTNRTVSGGIYNNTYDTDDNGNRLTKVNGGTVTTTVPGTSNKISAVGANAHRLAVCVLSL